MSVQRPPSRTAASDYSASLSRHRPTGSVSSNVSNSRSDREGTPSMRNSHSKRSAGVESNVTRLLVAIKKLLEGLTDWSNGVVSDLQISDMYVRLGNDFNAAVVAFDAFGIDMGDLRRVPDDLRDILERCLAEDASPDNLALYLPGVRKIITHLLEGLKTKQDEYRTRGGSHQGGSSRSRRSSKSELAYDEVSQAEDSGTQTPRSMPTPKSTRSVASELPSDSTKARRPAEARRGVSASDTERRTHSTSSRTPSGSIPIPPVPNDGPATPRHSSQRRGQISRSASATPAPPETDADTPRVKASPRTVRQASSGSTSSPAAKNVDLTATPKAETRNIIPPEVPRYSLQDPPLSGSFSVEVTSPTTPAENSLVDAPRPSTPEVTNTPAVESSLAALKQSEALQRRASKRFSTYTMSKMAGSVMGSSPSASSALRRSMAVGSLLTAGDLVALTEVDENAEDTSMSSTRGNRELGRKRSFERRQRAPTVDEPFKPPVPALPSTDTDTETLGRSMPAVNGITPHAPASSVKQSAADRPESPREMTVYFQVGRQVKKVVMEPVTSFAALRVLFMNKFLYNPGQDNFPEIYIRDPASGVQYELEDVSEVKDKCLLSLNIEPLDQIKQHIDSQIATLSQEIKDLKSTVSASRRMSLTPVPVSPGLNTSTTLVSRPTERQFQTMAQRINKTQSRTPTLPPLVPQTTGTSDVGSVTSGRIVSDLKTQFDEVQNIRRDLGVMRQIYVEFTNSTKESLAALRTQATAVRQVANTKVGGARASIDSGKARIDKRSQDVLTDIEDLQDTVESLKDDVLRRHITPKLDAMKRLRTKIDSTSKELDDLKTHITTIRPAWKKTWEQELQNIVEEQQFLAHQEQLIEDLIEDNKALVEVFGHIEKVISIRGSGAGRSRSFKPLPPSEGHGGLSTVMLEIRGAQVDPDRRMKAIEQNQKARQKELMSRSDEFQAELSTFVDQKKLRKTGGAEDVERRRQHKDALAFQAMFANQAQMAHSSNASATSGAMSSNGFGLGGISGFSGGLPGLTMAPAMDSDSEDDISPVGSPIYLSLYQVSFVFERSLNRSESQPFSFIFVMLSFYLFFTSILFLGVEAFYSKPFHLKRLMSMVPFADAEVRQCGMGSEHFQDTRLRLLFSRAISSSDTKNQTTLVSLKVLQDVDASRTRETPNLAEEAEYRYHIHQRSCMTLSLVRDCALAGPHHDPYGAGRREPYKCDPNDSMTCEAGDLSGKHGILRVRDLVGSEPYVYFDDFIDLDGVDTVINRAVVVHTLDGMRVACGDIHRVKEPA
ncbi:Bud site selection protein 6 [Serendipita sp. 399]|nr:Bud site selection protein 6 [Serendipita sp. 399]